MITAITCTGNRPEAFALCAGYMARQTYKGDVQWIVVCDDFDPSKLAPLLKSFPKNIKPELYQGPKVWAEGKNTHQGNMLEALSHVEGDKILFFEDDDWYSPRYVEEMCKALDTAEVIGEANACYYNLQYPGWKRMQNYSHASLCQTGIRKSMLPDFEVAVNSGNKYFDIELWKGAHRQGKVCIMFADFNLCIGIKGMPGREGIGVGHLFDGYQSDPYLNMLKKWLGADSVNYLPFAKGLQNGKEKQEASGVRSGSGIDSQETRRRGRPRKSGTGIVNPQSQPKSQAQKPNA